MGSTLPLRLPAHRVDALAQQRQLVGQPRRVPVDPVGVDGDEVAAATARCSPKRFHMSSEPRSTPPGSAVTIICGSAASTLRPRPAARSAPAARRRYARRRRAARRSGRAGRRRSSAAAPDLVETLTWARDASGAAQLLDRGADRAASLRRAGSGGQPAEAQHRRGDTVERRRLVDVHRHAEPAQRGERGRRKAAAPDDDKVGLRGCDALEVDVMRGAPPAAASRRLGKSGTRWWRRRGFPRRWNSCSVRCGARLTTRCAGSADDLGAGVVGARTSVRRCRRQQRGRPRAG